MWTLREIFHKSTNQISNVSDAGFRQVIKLYQCNILHGERTNLNVHKTFRRRPEHRMCVQFTSCVHNVQQRCKIFYLSHLHMIQILKKQYFSLFHVIFYWSSFLCRNITKVMGTELWKENSRTNQISITIILSRVQYCVIQKVQYSAIQKHSI